MMRRSSGLEVLDLLLSRTNNQWTRLSTCIFTTSWAKKWRLNGLNHGTARIKLQDSQEPASGAAAWRPVQPTAGQASPRPRGNKDMAHKECGCQQDRPLVAMAHPLRAEEPRPRPHPSPPTLYPHRLEASPHHRASHRAMAPHHSSVLATVLLPHPLISLPLQGSLLHLPPQGLPRWPSHHLRLRLPQT